MQISSVIKQHCHSCLPWVQLYTKPATPFKSHSFLWTGNSFCAKPCSGFILQTNGNWWDQQLILGYDLRQYERCSPEMPHWCSFPLNCVLKSSNKLLWLQSVWKEILNKLEGRIERITLSFYSQQLIFEKRIWVQQNSLLNAIKTLNYWPY